MNIIINDIKQWLGSVEKESSVLFDYALYSHPDMTNPHKENVAAFDTPMLITNLKLSCFSIWNKCSTIEFRRPAKMHCR